ncbi:FAD-dependent monooxygenase [Halotalea alkalilenta]|uniref:FAD-dependent monooxygenase n=1 Tax=Halotalea alkalilenta TaxID=376489 RepID=UPI00069341EE|nr:FAD-dependent monooxygenase [Halotalea alkalilenta]
MSSENQVDLAVVGLGSVGLCTALAALEGGLSVAVIDPQSADDLAAGEFDGRDVAISSASLRWLESLGVIQGLSEQERSPIRGARVVDRLTDSSLDFAPAPGEASIGAFVPEHRLRELAFRALSGRRGVVEYLGAKPVAVERDARGARLTLDDGRCVEAKLVAVADGRRSPLRALLGIGIRQHDYALRMLCCRVAHSRDHDGWTVQRFEAGGCVATLPLCAGRSSLALMLPWSEAERLKALDDQAFTAWLGELLGDELGEIRLESRRFDVPLASHYAEHFHVERAVLLGDAAVGMLPITAHGLNLGLINARSLVAELLAARQQGEEFSDGQVLERVSRRAHATAWPLYRATNEICRLFRREDPLSRQARRLLFRVAGPLESLVGLNCEQDDPRQIPWLGVLRALPGHLWAQRKAS